MVASSSWTGRYYWPAALSLLVVILFLTPLRTTDLWWHLDSGRWMIEHGQYLGHEVSSFSLPGAAWTNFSWLFQVLIAGVERVGGLWGLLLFKGAIWWMILFVLLYSARAEQVPIAILLAPLLVSWQLFPFMGLRPHLFEGIFLACAVWLIHRTPDSKDPLWYALLIILWANSHASAAVGAAALALHYMVGGNFRLPAFSTLLRRVPVALLLCSMVFVSPNGFGILRVLIEHSSGDYLHFYIREWISPHQLPEFMFITLVAIAVGAYIRRGLITPAETLLIMLFLVLSNNSHRFLYELCLVLIRPSAVLIAMLLQRLDERHATGRGYRAWVFGLLLVGLLSIIYSPPFSLGKLRAADYPASGERFPHVATSVLQPVVEGESELRVWNNYGSGGYLEWWGHGRVKVYIDGRTPTVFNEEMMLNEKLSRSRPRLLRSQLNQWNADAVLLGHISVLPIPPGDPEWTLVGFDRESALYLRSQLVRRYSLSGIGFDPFNPWSSFNSLDVDQAIQSLHHMLEQDSDNDLAWQYLGQFLSYGRSHGDDTVLAQAMEAFQHAIELNPANGMARLSLASLQLTTGQAGATAVQPILDQLDDFGPVGFLGVETQVASMLLESGYPQQAINVLSPAEWYRHQQLDADFNVWSLRRKAHSKLGEKEKSDFDRRMEKRLALDLQPDKSR